jgi:hypothetical protein
LTWIRVGSLMEGPLTVWGSPPQRYGGRRGRGRDHQGFPYMDGFHLFPTDTRGAKMKYIAG